MPDETKLGISAELFVLTFLASLVVMAEYWNPSFWVETVTLFVALASVAFHLASLVLSIAYVGGDTNGISEIEE